jgi:hypothetical protein
MANEYSLLAEIRDYIGDTKLRVEVVHREDGGKGYRLSVFEPDKSFGDQGDYLGETETQCIREHF